MAILHARPRRLVVLVVSAGVIAGAVSAGNSAVARAATTPGTGGYSCPGSIGDRHLSGPTNVGVPGVEVQGDATNSFLVTCSYEPGSPVWAIEVAWTPIGSDSPTFEGCGSTPNNPNATWVSKDHFAYAGTNLDDPPGALAVAAQAALTDVVKLASPCPPAPGASPSDSPSATASAIGTGESSASADPSTEASPSDSASPSASPSGKPLCDEAIRYYGDTLNASGVSDSRNTGLHTSGAELVAGFGAVIAAYDATHKDSPAHAPVSSTVTTMGAINWLWEVGGLNSKIWGIKSVFGNAPTQGYVTGKEQRLGQKIKTSTHPLTPSEVFAISLDINNGDVTSALLTAHNTLRALGRGDYVDQELTLVDKAAPDMYGKNLADLRSDGENAGPWYHLFGTAYFELVSTETGQREAGAQAAAFGADPAPAGASSVRTAAEHFAPDLPNASVLSDFANWMEQQVRAHNGSKPDPEKYCVNVWGAKLGAALAQQMGGTASYANSSFEFDPESGALDVLQSPFSVRWTTPQGTTTIDQKTGAVSFGTPLLVYPLYEGDTWGAAWVPPAHTSGSVTFVATAPGAQLHFMRIDKAGGQALLYLATATSAGEELTLPLGDAVFGEPMKTSDGESIPPQRLSFAAGAAPPAPEAPRARTGASMNIALIGALGAVVVLGVGGGVLLARRRRRATATATI